MKYRLIILREKDCFTQMAIDEAILKAVTEGESQETMRYFDFLPPAITIGRLQKIDDINTNFCKRIGVDIVRRLTGGRAVIHYGDFTFSLIIRRDNPIFGGNTYETYKAISASFLSTLKSFGLPVTWERVKHHGEKKRKLDLSHNPLCFSSISRYELTMEKRKVLGIAQYRKSDTVLVQGSLLLGKTPDAFRELFMAPVPPDNLSYVEEEVSNDISFEKFGSKLKDEMEKIYRVEIVYGKLSNMELRRAETLRKRYKSYEWNYSNAKF